jgi:hypothetical protein
MGTKIDGGGPNIPVVRSDPKPATTSAPAQAPAAAPAGWSPTVNVAGSDRRTQMRMGTDPQNMAAQNNMSIACPVLKALVAEGSVHVDPQGRVNNAELLAALKAHGMTGPTLEAIRGITYFANQPTDIPKNMASQSFDIMHLRSGLTMHDSDSNILSQGQFNEAAFDKFTSGAKNGYMDEQAFADAVRANTEGDMKAQNPLTALTFGQNAVLAEYPVLMKLFNTTGPDGKPAIKVDDLKALFKDGKLPSNAPPGSIGILNSSAAYATMLSKVEPKLAGDVFRSTATATGMALEGAKLSGGDDKSASANGATAAAGKGAAAAAKCPFMNGAAKMPNPVQDAVDVHNN